MPYYLPPDYLDNTPGKSLAEALRRIILEMEQRQLDIATGFFDPQVWELLGEALMQLDRFRLLLGTEPDLEGRAGDGRLDLRAYYKRIMQGELEALPLNARYAALVDELLLFLDRSGVDIKLYPSFLHAKAYLFQRVAIVGSSNFTLAGVTRKAELNLVNKSDTVANALREDWFEPFWDEAEAYKDDLIQALRDSKFGTTPYTPFDVFIKALYEYFKDRLSMDSPEAHLGVNLATFQQEGLREAIRLLDRHRGVMIADAVGLGKTYIGMGLLEHYLLKRRRKGRIPKGLVVCPAQLRDLVWNPKLDEYGIKATVRSMEEVSRQDFDWKLFSHYDLVLVDESHNFRNPSTGRHQNLNKIICTGKRDKFVILMTATPINNSIWDLYHQLMLMTRGSDHYYRTVGIGNLKGFFQRVVEGAAELFTLLEETAVRRSRYDIKKRQQAGEEVRLPGKGVIQFPKRLLHTIEYNLERTYRGFYAEIATSIERLSLVSYNLEQFHRDQDQQVVDRNNALIGILKTTFLKRLESSLRAFEVSVERQRKFQGRFMELLQEGRLLDSPSRRKLLSLEAEDAHVEEVDELLSALPEIEPDEYDLGAIQECVAADLEILNDLLTWAEIVRQDTADESAQDAKLAALKASLSGDLRDKKVLIFTYYEDTARYLYHKLTADEAWIQEAGEPSIGLISGSTDPGQRERLVRRFAPIANTSNEPEFERERAELLEDQLDILVSTDVLSEGQNLQDAGVLVNYDLHWNPVRMIQRAGRIDRLGSPYDQLHIYNCFPEDGLESLLNLVGRLQQRIADIDRTVGLDASVLGEVIHPKSLTDIKRIKAGDRDVLDELELTAELVSADEMKFPLIQYLQAIGEQRVKEIPLGIHSGKRAPIAGTFFAFRAGERHFWRFYPADGSPPLKETRRIFNLIRCSVDEPRIVADHEIFPLLEQATRDILDEVKAQQTSRKIRPQMKGLNKEFYAALQQPSMLEENVPDDLRQRVGEVMMHVSLDPFRRDPRLKAIRATYKADGSLLTLAEQLDAYFVEHDLYREFIEPSVLEQITEESLQLVCYEVLSGRGMS